MIYRYSYLPTIGNVLAVVSVINRNIPQFHIQYIIYGSGDIQLSVSVLLCLILVQLPRIPNHIRMLLPTAGLITATQPPASRQTNGKRKLEINCRDTEARELMESMQMENIFI